LVPTIAVSKFLYRQKYGLSTAKKPQLLAEQKLGLCVCGGMTPASVINRT
jgi:hypothetical protein